MESILTLFSGFRWQDGLDILLNAYILFRLYVLFRGTNVFRGLLAIAILWGCGQAALTLGLIITNWAMQGVIAVAALIVIIVFRNEIAGVLQTRDFKSFFWGIPKYQSNTPLDIITKSVFELANKKIGALIVLPLKQGLGNVLQNGIPVDGELTQQLLTGLFWPDSPLHDGAVIIQGNRITSAGAILPLSKNDHLPAAFGTRHRAASGLSELTDALVIVVSEERGRISVFKEERIFRPRKPVDLEQLLNEHIGEDPSRKKALHQSLELTAVGLISLICVTGIWANFSKGMETFARQEIPIEFIIPDQRMEIVSTSASSANLLISGAKPLIKSVKPEQLNIKVNLSQATIGENQVNITPKDILLPPGIRLKSIEPPQILVTLDTLVEKQLPIQPDWVGKLPKGFTMAEAKVVPEVIKVTGGGLVLKNVATIFTDKIELGKLTESGTVTTTLIPDPPSIKLVSSPKVKIQFRIVKKSKS